MNAKDLILNIAVNLGRIARFAMENKPARVRQFLNETEEYLRALETAPKSKQFQKTLDRFKTEFETLKQAEPNPNAWAETALTWANILAHRAKLA